MEPEEREELCNTGPEEETMALQKKRSRRVSFAEITSVHVFDRDEDFETPPDSKPSSENPESGQANENLGFHQDLGDSDDSKELLQKEDGDDVEDEDEGVLFMQDLDSNSPGSAIGSVTSNEGKFLSSVFSFAAKQGVSRSSAYGIAETLIFLLIHTVTPLLAEDNFFGPVSASFIRSGRLSDSAASDDNHDITLDSTTFSCHFRSLMRSDSGGDFKTPTGVHLAIEERTPSQNSMPTTTGSFMVLTGAKKPHPRSSVSGGKSSGSSDSNDMSLIDENPHRYDYGRLSPGLDSLLAEGIKDLHAGFVSDRINISKPSIYLNNESRFSTHDEHQSGVMDQKSLNKVLGNVDNNNTPSEVISDTNIKLCESNGGFATSPIDQISYGRSLSPKDSLACNASFDCQNQSLSGSTQGMPFGMDKGSGIDAPKATESELGFVVGNSGIITSPNKILQMVLFPQHGCGYLGSAEDLIKEKYPKNAGDTPNIGQNSDQHCRSPLAGSVSALRARRQQIFLDTTDSSGSEWIGTPFARKQPSSSLNGETIRHGESVSSIKESICKFRIHETSPFVTSLEVGLDNSKPASSDYLSKSLSFDTVLEENNEDPKLKYVDTFDTSLKGHLLSVAPKITDKKNVINMDSYLVETPKSGRILRQTEESTGPVEDGECLDQISTGMLCSDQPSKLRAAAVSLHFSGSGKQMQPHLLSYESLTEGALVTPEPDSSFIDITHDLKGNKKSTSTSDKFIHSPIKRLEKKSITPEHQGILSRALNQQLVILGLRQDGIDSIENATNVSHSTPTADKLGSSLKVKSTNSCSPFNEINSIYPRDYGQWKGMGDKEYLLHNLKDSGNIGGCQTPSSITATLNSQPGSLDRNLQIGTDPARFKKKLSEREISTSSCETASPNAHSGTATVPQLGKSMVELVTQSPSRKEPYNLSENDNMPQFVRKDPVSPKSIECLIGHGHTDCHQGLHISQKPFSLRDAEDSYGRKRRREENILRDKDHINEFGRIQKSPKVHEVEVSSSLFPLEPSNARNNEVDKIGGDVTLNHWGDVQSTLQAFSKFCGATKLLLSPLTDNLHSQQLDILEDILVRLQKAKKYEKLCTDIQSQTYWFLANTESVNCFPQKTNDLLGNLQQNRVAETRWLLHMLANEQAKLQLMRVKQERLLKRVQLLNSGIQESQILKLNSLLHLCVPGVRDDQKKDSHPQSLSVDSNEINEDAYNKVNTMREEREALDKKIKNITKSFQASCKMKGEPSSTETIISVNDHLKKRTYCRFIHQDLQIWDVDDLESDNDHHNIVLNYRNFLFQRFTINVGSVQSIITSNKLNDVSVMKNFPNINACTAFAFVLYAETAQKRSLPKSLTQETQITSSRLGNLLDVVEEVQIARIELPNLIQTSFYSPCVEQLDLQLCFLDFKSGMKVILTLDISCLNCGIYPSEIIPSQLQSRTSTTETPLPQSLSTEITAAVGNLKSGFSRIIRLCRCVSKVVQASSRQVLLACFLKMTGLEQSASSYTWGFVIVGLC
ncbi:hypothetical protein HHK36_005855 [Tetracentron sinense]|uniref:Knl1 C-terminal RWD domain-containing protein n=1 Tax=Tetracentron sinense TaxID=13715 RepID=A0A834ZV52_TETSI|nr:hypothetical protein HHK36_005855 [Tetracentron sinense]